METDMSTEARTLHLTNDRRDARAVIFTVDNPGFASPPIVMEEPTLPATSLWRFNRWAAILFRTAISKGKTIPILVDRDTRLLHQQWENATMTGSWPDPAVFPAAIDDEKEASMVPGGNVAAWVEFLEDRSIWSAVAPCSPQHKRMARAAAMFREFDYQTNPVLFARERMPNEPGSWRPMSSAEKSFREMVVNETVAKLVSRFKQNLALNDTPVLQIPRAWIAYLSELQLTIFRRWYPFEAESVSVSADTFGELAQAFVWFGAGRLYLWEDISQEQRLQGVRVRSEGGPNSWLIFLFAEFAAVAISYDINRAHWERLLGAFAAMLRAYALGYADWDSGKPIPRSLESYEFRPGHSSGVTRYDRPKRPLRCVEDPVLEDLLLGIREGDDPMVSIRALARSIFKADASEGDRQ